MRSTTLALMSVLVFAAIITTTWGLVTIATADQSGEDEHNDWCEHIEESYHDPDEHHHHHDAIPAPNDGRHHMGEKHCNGHR